jgi:hypothetical protein
MHANDLRQIALAFDEALETKNLDKILNSFTSDCEIELLNIKLLGKEGVKKWFNWLYKHIKTLKLVPITIMVQENIFLRNF